MKITDIFSTSSKIKPKTFSADGLRSVPHSSVRTSGPVCLPRKPLSKWPYRIYRIKKALGLEAKYPEGTWNWNRRLTPFEARARWYTKEYHDGTVAEFAAKSAQDAETYMQNEVDKLLAPTEPRKKRR